MEATDQKTLRLCRAILVADDSTDDTFLLQRAFRNAGIDVPLAFVLDGQEAIDYLSGADRFADRTVHPSPGLLLLDLKMPRVNGFEVLEWWQKQEDLRLLPIIVWTSSTAPSDLTRARELGANSYLIKPSSAQGYTEIAEKLWAQWLESNPQRSV